MSGRRLHILQVAVAALILCIPATRVFAGQLSQSLAPADRASLIRAAAEPGIAPWQRDLMLEAAGPPGRLAKSGVLARDSSGAGALRAEGVAIDGTWSRVATEAPDWTPPTWRFSAAVAFDAARRRMIVFGGGASAYLNDTWELTLSPTPKWHQLAPLGTPPAPRRLHGAVYDSIHDRMIVYGGFNGSYLGDVWALDFTGTPTWTQLTPAGSPPAARADFALIYDPTQDRVVLFGGYDGVTLPDLRLSDVWSLDLAGAPAWHKIDVPAGPTARSGHRGIYDPVRNRMVVFGGYDSWYLNDVWALSLGATPSWTPILPSGSLPAARVEHSVLYDSVQDCLLVFGGEDNDYYYGDTWVLPLASPTSWTLLEVYGATPRWGQAAAYDAGQNSVFMFGGYSYGVMGDTWALDLAGMAWSELIGGPVAPSPRVTTTMIADPIRHRLLLFGGGGGPAFMSDTWELSLGVVPGWSQLITAGTPPPGRRLHGAVYDPVRDRMIVFGGESGAFLNDVWALSLDGTPTWTELVPAGTPPAPRSDFAMIYDAAADRVVVFGGYDGVSPPSNRRADVWALNLSGTPTWQELTPASGPTARSGHRAIYDPLRGRMVVFGGYDQTYRWEVWALSLTGTPTWTEIDPLGTPPLLRVEHSVLYDALRDRMVVYGGYLEIIDFADVWTLSLAGQPTWTKLQPEGQVPPGRWGHGAALDPGGDRMIIFGGASNLYGYVMDDTWALTWDIATPVQVSLSSTEVGPRLVRLTWLSVGDEQATVYRSQGGGVWTALGTLMTDGRGYLVYEDRTVEPGLTYSYRLGVLDGEREVFVGETSVQVPLGVSLGIQVPSPWSGRGNLVLRCTLPESQPARLALFDPMGRQLLSREVGGAAGARDVDLGSSTGFPAGRYLARLEQAGRKATTGVVILH